MVGRQRVGIAARFEKWITGMEADRLPITLLTGFLGSGKTTLLNSWLTSPLLADAAVVVNEFGEIGIDHTLIAHSSDNTVELTTGCLCCTVRGDLVDTLRNLNERRSRGEIRAFNRVIIETTGLADPAPVIQALMTFPVARKFVLDRVITTIDGVQGMTTLDNHAEAVKQAAVADDLIVTKSDISPATEVLVTRLRRLNAGARFALSGLGRAPSAEVTIGRNIYDPTTKTGDVVAWLNAEAYANPATDHQHSHHQDDGCHSHDVNRHDAQIGSFCLDFETPLQWEHVAHWLDALVIAHGDDLLRVKGILKIAGREKPIVVQAVQRLFHPPFELASWPQDDTRSKIVFITRGLTRDYVFDVLSTLQTRAAAEIRSASLPAT